MNWKVAKVYDWGETWQWRVVLNHWKMSMSEKVEGGSWMQPRTFYERQDYGWLLLIVSEKMTCLFLFLYFFSFLGGSFLTILRLYFNCNISYLPFLSANSSIFPPWLEFMPSFASTVIVHTCVNTHTWMCKYNLLIPYNVFVCMISGLTTEHWKTPSGHLLWGALPLPFPDLFSFLQWCV